jgi:8-oxo-dGTP pyrophosphatase MutT (NUDIX family)
MKIFFKNSINLNLKADWTNLKVMKKIFFPKVLENLKNPKLLEHISKINFYNNHQSPIISIEGQNRDKVNVYDRKTLINNIPTQNPIHIQERKLKKPVSSPNAAVLLLLFLNKHSEYSIVFIERTKRGKHPGQLAFPGGKLDPNETLRECAIREAEEEVFIKRENIKILNEIPPIVTFTTNVQVQPFIGTFDRSTFGPWQFQKTEVTKVIEVSLKDVIENFHERTPFFFHFNQDHTHEGFILFSLI